MRLIDADDFMKKLLRVKRINKESPLLNDDPEINNYDVGQEETFDLVIRKLSEQPTAYDIERVVAELKEWTFNADVNLGDGIKNSDLIASKNAIEIVKRGGVNED